MALRRPVPNEVTIGDPYLRAKNGLPRNMRPDRSKKVINLHAGATIVLELVQDWLVPKGDTDTERVARPVSGQPVIWVTIPKRSEGSIIKGGQGAYYVPDVEVGGVRKQLRVEKDGSVTLTSYVSGRQVRGHTTKPRVDIVA